MVMQSPVADAPYAPRLCLVQKTFPEQEYGFNLHAERGKGQYIGHVDPDSPADHASLRTGDRIIAVNGAHIADETHKQVVNRVKENSLQCELLVVDEAGETWYRDHGVAISIGLPNVVRCSAAGRHQLASASPSPPPDPSRADEPPADYDRDADNTAYSTPPVDESHVYAQVHHHEKTTHHHTGDDKQNAVAGEAATPTVVAARPPPPSGGHPRARLCVLQKGWLEEEFGFNLHAEKAKGHFIGKVDVGSVADRAGLVLGQRIVGVNGTLVYPTTPHKVVVGLIKADNMRAQLLVASEETDKYYLERGLEFSFADCDRVNTVVVSKEPTRAHPNATAMAAGVVVSNSKSDTVSQHSSISSSSHHSEQHAAKQRHPGVDVNGSVPTKKTDDRSSTGSDSSKHSTPLPPSATAKEATEVLHYQHSQVTTTERLPSPASTNDSFGAPPSNDDDPFSLSAAELRERLSLRKHRDPRTDAHLSLAEKHRIVANM